MSSLKFRNISNSFAFLLLSLLFPFSVLFCIVKLVCITIGMLTGLFRYIYVTCWFQGLTKYFIVRRKDLENKSHKDKEGCEFIVESDCGRILKSLTSSHIQWIAKYTKPKNWDF